MTAPGIVGQMSAIQEKGYVFFRGFFEVLHLVFEDPCLSGLIQTSVKAQPSPCYPHVHLIRPSAWNSPSQRTGVLGPRATGASLSSSIVSTRISFENPSVRLM